MHQYLRESSLLLSLLLSGAIAGEIPGSELLELQQCMFQKNTATLYDGGVLLCIADIALKSTSLVVWGVGNVQRPVLQW